MLSIQKYILWLSAFVLLSLTASSVLAAFPATGTLKGFVNTRGSTSLLTTDPQINLVSTGSPWSFYVSPACSAVGRTNAYTNDLLSTVNSLLSLTGYCTGVTVVKGTAYTCPSNATVSGSTCSCNTGYIEQSGACVPDVPTCVSPQVLNPQMNICQQPCVQDQKVGSYVSTSGISIGAEYCQGGCWIGPTIGLYTDGGAYLSYSQTGAMCNTNADPAVNASNTLVKDAAGNIVNPDYQTKTEELNCLEQGKTFGYVNGKVTCTTPGPGTTSKSSVTASDGTKTTTTTTNNVDGSSTSTVLSTTTGGVTSSTTTSTSATGEKTVTTSGTGSGLVGNTGTATGDDVMGSGGPATDGLYTKAAGQGISGLLTKFKTDVQATGIYQSVQGFWNVSAISGSCPSWTLPSTEFTPSIPVDFFCQDWAYSAYSVVSAVLMVMASYLAFRFAFL